MFQLFPKDRWFFESFNGAAAGLHEAARIFVELLQNNHEPQKCIALTQKIKELEHAGDRLTHSVVDRLNKSFLTPYDREDIYSLIIRLDDVLDMMDGASSRIILYKIGSPPAKLVRQVEVLENATAVLNTLVREMKPRMTYASLQKYFEQVHTHENEGDLLHREALSELFDSRLDAITVIKLKEIHEYVESAIDKCEDVANVIEGICVKHA